MSLNPEWLRRVNNWRDELPQHFYRPLSAIALSGFVTKDQLTADEAARGPFRPMPKGATWGAKWEYGWFKGEFTFPPEAAGKRIACAWTWAAKALSISTGSCGRQRPTAHRDHPGDERHARRELPDPARRLCGTRPARRRRPGPPGRQTVPEPPDTPDGRGRPALASGRRRSISSGWTWRRCIRSARTLTPTRCAWPRSTPACATSRSWSTLNCRPTRWWQRSEARAAPQAAAGVRQWLHVPEPLRLRPRAHRRGLAVAAGGDGAQDGAHLLHPARADGRVP